MWASAVSTSRASAALPRQLVGVLRSEAPWRRRFAPAPRRRCEGRLAVVLGGVTVAHDSAAARRNLRHGAEDEEQAARTMGAFCFRASSSSSECRRGKRNAGARTSLAATVRKPGRWRLTVASGARAWALRPAGRRGLRLVKNDGREAVEAGRMEAEVPHLGRANPTRAARRSAATAFVGQQRLTALVERARPWREDRWLARMRTSSSAGSDRRRSSARAGQAWRLHWSTAETRTGADHRRRPRPRPGRARARPSAAPRAPCRSARSSRERGCRRLRAWPTCSRPASWRSRRSRRRG